MVAMAIQLDVGKIVFAGFDFGGIFLVQVAQRLDVLVAVKRVVVEIDLGVEADDLAILGHDQRVDFQKAHVLGDECLVEALDHLADLLGGVAFQLQGGGDLVSDIGRVTDGRLDLEGLDLFRRLVRHFLDVHAALGGDDEGDAAGGAVHQGGKIKLAIDRRTVLDVEALDHAALRAGLVRDQGHA
jgi:hypothetical protein